MLFFTGVYVLSRAGFAAGVGVMLVSIALMGVVYVGRRLGFVLIALTALAHMAVGLLVTRGIIHLDAQGSRPDDDAELVPDGVGHRRCSRCCWR